MPLTYQLNDIKNWEQRYRATFINSLAGIKQLVLIGTQSPQGLTNLAIFNSLMHIGANPALYGILFRPDTVKRDTLDNILQTESYSFNYVSAGSFKQAHQTSAKYDTNTSEFQAVGFTEQYAPGFLAPFVQEAKVKIAMKLEDRIDIKINGTILIIGSLQYIEIHPNMLSADGFVALEKENVLACAGLDAYYQTDFINRLSYAKPDKEPSIL